MQKKQNNKNKNKLAIVKAVTKVAAPVATAKIVHYSPPRVLSKVDGSVRIHHREFLADIAGSVAFNATQQFQINPGLVLTFPWLSSIARRFESYKLNALKFFFETSAPTSTTGTILLTMDYDPTDPAPLSKTQALSYRSSVRSAPWQDCCLTCDRPDLNKRSTYYTRGSFVTSTDLHLYDIGNLFVCVGGQAGTSAIGELYVEYDIHLMTPQLEASSGIDKSLTAAGSIAPGTPFGTSQVMVGGLPIFIDSYNPLNIFFNAIGDYFLFWNVVGTGITEPLWTSGAGTTFTKISANIAGGTNMSYLARIRVTDPVTGYSGPNNISGWTTLTSSRLYITQCVYTDFA